MISVIMGVYNGEKTVRRAVLSILEGNYKYLEFVVVDDGSTDNTYVILKELSNSDSRLKIIKSEKNNGLASALNTALTYCAGEYIARQDADDISYSNRLQMQMDYLNNHSELAFVSASARLMEGINSSWGIRTFPEVVSKKTLIKYNPFIHPCLLIKKEAIMAINGYNEDKKRYRCEDYDLYFRLYAKGYIGGNVQDVLMDYYEKTDSAYRHSVATRKNEFLARVSGVKALKGSIIDYLYCLKPLMLALLPWKIYNKLHNAKWRNNEEV